MFTVCVQTHSSRLIRTLIEKLFLFLLEPEATDSCRTYRQSNSEVLSLVVLLEVTLLLLGSVEDRASTLFTDGVDFLRSQAG
jgi:hypothetical protein